MFSLQQCRNAGDVAKRFKAIFLSSDKVHPGLVTHINDKVIERYYSRKQSSRLSSTFMSDCITALGKEFSNDKVLSRKKWTPRYVLKAAFVMIQLRQMLADRSPKLLYSQEEFLERYSDDAMFCGVSEDELPLLVSFRNAVVATLETVKEPNQKKKMVMFIACSLSVGVMTTCQMGSGQNQHVDRREAIYHTESGIPMKQRVRKPSSDTDSSDDMTEPKPSKRKSYELDLPPSFGDKKTKVPKFSGLSLSASSEQPAVAASTGSKLTPPIGSEPISRQDLSVQLTSGFGSACISGAFGLPAAPSSDNDLTTSDSPPRLLCDVLLTIPTENTSSAEYFLPPRSHIPPAEPMMDPLGFVESLRLYNMRDGSFGEAAPYPALGSSPAELAADVTDDESCTSMEGEDDAADPDRQELRDFLRKYGFPVCASELQTDEMQDQDAAKQCMSTEDCTHFGSI